MTASQEPELKMRYRSVRSSNLVAVGHDAATATLGVIFKSGATYHYAGVPRARYLALTSRTLRSVGRYFNDQVRGHYPATRVDPHPPPQKAHQIKADACPRCGGAWGSVGGSPRCRGCGYAPELEGAIMPRGQTGTGRVMTGITEDFNNQGDVAGGPLLDLFEKMLTGGDLGD